MNYKTKYTRNEVIEFLNTHCKFDDNEIVYVLFGLSRNKLNKGNDTPQRKISRVIRKLDKIDLVIDEIEKILNGNNFYLYVSVNPRSIAKASIDVSHRIINALHTQNYDEIKKTEGMWTSALMDIKARYGRGKFMLDIDTKSSNILNCIKDNFEILTLRETQNGYHALINPCNPDLIDKLKLSEFVGIKKDDILFLNSYMLEG